MASCVGNIAGNIGLNCESPIEGGYTGRGVLIPMEAVPVLTKDASNPRVISAIAIAQNAKVVLVDNEGQTPFDGSQTATRYILRALSGWLGSPDAKVNLVERANGDGAHDVPASTISYAARTVSVEYRLLPRDAHGRDELLAMQDSVRAFLHKHVRVRVRDETMDTYCDGYVAQLTMGENVQNVNRQTQTGTIDIVCNRPEILATTPQTGQLLPYLDSRDGNGLSYNQRGLETYWMGEPNNSVSVLRVDVLSGTSGLAYPLKYLTRRKIMRPNQVTFVNHGSSRAYPVFTCNGPMPDGVDLVVEGTGQWLRCAQPVFGEPLVLDSRSRTATVGGLDVSRTLVSRGFPVVPPHGSITVTLRTSGDGWVDASMRDTWM